ncbi:MAG: D-amino acid dehydrogenase [Pseudomonadota bacterium]
MPNHRTNNRTNERSHPISHRSSQPSVAVIGAGITGMTTAFRLQQQGYDVTVIERHRYAAMETSFANGGQLSASNAEVWNSVGTMMKGLKWLFKADAPLLLNLKPSWHKYSWLAEFIAAVPHYRQNTIKTVELALAARDSLLEMGRDAGVDCNFEHRGIMHFYKSKAEFDDASKVTGLLREGGLERIALSPDEAKAKEPSLNTKDVYGAFYTDSDFTGDIHKYTNGLAAAFRLRGGTLLTDTTVTDLAPDDEGVTIDYQTADQPPHRQHYDAIVVCAGVGSRSLAQKLGDRVNVYPVKGYSITVNLTDEASQAAAPWVSLLDDRAKIVTSRLGVDRYRVAGTAEFNGYNRNIRMDRIKPLIAWCEEHHLGMSTRDCVPWAGLRPMMPTMLPKVGPGRAPRVFYNTGHGHLGWTLSAATADMVTAHITAALPTDTSATTSPMTTEPVTIDTHKTMPTMAAE